MHMFMQDLPSTMTSACHLLCLYLGQPFIFSPIVSFWPSTFLCLYFLPYIWFASCLNFYLCYYVALDWLFRCFDLACAFLLLCITPDFSLPCSLFSAFYFCYASCLFFCITFSFSLMGFISQFASFLAPVALFSVLFQFFLIKM